jgi:hypothetical protein
MMIIGGGIMFVVLVVVIIRGGVVEQTKGKVAVDVNKYKDKYLGIYQFYDNFDSGKSGLWKNSSGNWISQNGVYNQTQHTGTPGQYFYSYINQYFDNFTLEFKFRTTGASTKTVGVGLRNNPWTPGNNYFLKLIYSVTTKEIRLYKGVTQIGGTISSPPDLTQWTLVKIKAYGGDFKVYINGGDVNGAPQITGSDTAFTKGFIGFFTYDGERAEFDDVRIWNEQN